MTGLELVNIRQATAGDVSFILDSWVKSYRRTGLLYAQPKEKDGVTCVELPPQDYWDGHHALVERILRRASTLVAETKAAPEIAAWICAEPPILHYVYVKQIFRRFGLCKAMLTGAGLTVASHWTPGAKHLPGEWRVDPYAAWLMPDEYSRATTRRAA